MCNIHGGALSRLHVQDVLPCRQLYLQDGLLWLLWMCRLDPEVRAIPLCSQQAARLSRHADVQQNHARCVCLCIEHVQYKAVPLWPAIDAYGNLMPAMRGEPVQMIDSSSHLHHGCHRVVPAHPALHMLPGL